MSLKTPITRPFEPTQDYELVAGWWKEHSKWGQPVPKEALPTHGLVTELEGKPVCAGWIYRTDSPLCLLEWVISDPKSLLESRTACLEQLLSDAKRLATQLGFSFIFTMTPNNRLKDRLVTAGFNVTDENVTHFMCNLRSN